MLVYAWKKMEADSLEREFLLYATFAIEMPFKCPYLFAFIVSDARLRKYSNHLLLMITRPNDVQAPFNQQNTTHEIMNANSISVQLQKNKIS